MRYLLTCGLAACLCWSVATAQTYDFDALKKAPGASKPAEAAKPTVTVRKAEAVVAAKPETKRSNSLPSYQESDKQLYIATAEQWLREYNSGFFVEADQLADQLLEISARPGMSQLSRADAHHAKSKVLAVVNLFDPAISHLQQALAIYLESDATDKVAMLESELQEVQLRKAQIAEISQQPEPFPDAAPDIDSTLALGWLQPYLDGGLDDAVELILEVLDTFKFYPGDTPLDMAENVLLMVVTSLVLALLTPLLLKALRWIGIVLVSLVSMPFYLLYLVARFSMELLIRYWYVATAIAVLAVINELFEGAIVDLASGLSIWHWAVLVAILLFWFGTRRLSKQEEAGVTGRLRAGFVLVLVAAVAIGAFGKKEEQPVPFAAPAPAVEAMPKVGQELKDCDVCPTLVVLPRGEFKMGSPEGEPERSSSEEPQRRVKIDYGLAVGKYEVSKREWQAVMGGNPSNFKGEDLPVEQVSWEDAQAYIKKLNARTGEKYGFRLLSESEWEYAARAGTSTPFSTGQTISTAQANFNGNHTYNGSVKGEYREKTMPVESFAANAYGLHNMHGNALEWVEDCWHWDYAGSPPVDGSAWVTSCNGDGRVLRGGSWLDIPKFLRSAYRINLSPGFRNDLIGFRLARIL